MGEVFTPERYVQQLLALFEPKLWSDENTIFFEPTCGHGNIAVPVFQRRISSFAKKYKAAKTKHPILTAIANALNTLWAVDICPENISMCRTRLLEVILSNLDTESLLSKQRSRDFIAHALCALVFQIQENEALSSLSDEREALAQASKTKLGASWLKKNKHKPIDFELSWCSYFVQVRENNSVPLIFSRATKFLEGVNRDGATRGFEEFEFAKQPILTATNNAPTRLRTRGAA